MQWTPLMPTVSMKSKGPKVQFSYQNAGDKIVGKNVSTLTSLSF